MHDRIHPCPRILMYRPPRIALFLLTVAALLNVFAGSSIPAGPPAPLAGGLIGALGFGIMIRAWWLFCAHETAICPTADSRELITHDIYRLTRNPMYLGIVLMLAGVAVTTGGVLYYVAAFAFFLVIDYAFCPFEEAKLTDRFGRRFQHYRRTVRRWL